MIVDASYPSHRAVRSRSWMESSVTLMSKTFSRKMNKSAESK